MPAESRFSDALSTARRIHDVYPGVFSSPTRRTLANLVKVTNEAILLDSHIKQHHENILNKKRAALERQHARHIKKMREGGYNYSVTKEGIAIQRQEVQEAEEKKQQKKQEAIGRRLKAAERKAPHSQVQAWKAEWSSLPRGQRGLQKDYIARKKAADPRFRVPSPENSGDAYTNEDSPGERRPATPTNQLPTPNDSGVILNDEGEGEVEVYFLDGGPGEAPRENTRWAQEAMPASRRNPLSTLNIAAIAEAVEGTDNESDSFINVGDN